MFAYSAFPKIRLLWIALVLAVAFPCHADPKKPQVKTGALNGKAASPKLILDTATIRKLYLDGDFDQAIDILETGLKEKRAFNHEDSVFIFKHLGVMYAAKYETREKGKYYMHQLLMVEPTARILDMYASDMIYMIFKNIQDEFEETRGKLSRAESHVVGNSQSRPANDPPADKQGKEKETAKEAPEPHGHQAVYWVGASTVAVAAGVAAYFLLADQPKSGKTHDVQ